MKLNVSGLTLNFEEFQNAPSGGEGKEEGRGEVIIFLHGWGGSSQSLLQLAQMLRQGSKMILLDLPGFGKSDNPPKSWGVGEYSQVVSNFIKTMGFGDVILVGHSFGASIALSIAAEHHGNIKKIVLCAPSYRRAQKPVPTFLFSLVRPIFDSFPLLKRGVYRIFFPHSDLMRFAHLQENFKKIIHEDLSEKAKKIHIPTLIVWGSEDNQTPVADAHSLHSLIPHSRLEIVQGHSHNLPVKYPEQIFEQINQFLK